LCTSNPTNVLRFAMTCLLWCVALHAAPPGRRAIHGNKVRQVSALDSHTV